MHTRQERTFNIFVGEKIEIDGYAVPDLESKRGATREVETRNRLSDPKSWAARLVSTSRRIVEAFDAEYQRGEAERARFDFACRNVCQHIADSFTAVTLYEPAPMCERAVVESLDDD